MEVEIVKKTMNIIEALMALKQGKKVTDKSWGKDTYVYLKGTELYDEDNDAIDLQLSDLESKDFEEYIERPKVEIKLSDEYTAIVTADGIEVGCTKIDMSTVKKLIKAVEKVKEM